MDTQVYFLYVFLISVQNMDCGLSLEPPHRGSSNEHPVVLLLLIYSLIYFRLFVCVVLCLPLFCYALLCVLSKCAMMSCYCKCSVALPHRAVGWSAMCDCGIS